MSLHTISSSVPLAERVRPNHLKNYIGQQHLCGPTGIITQSIQQGKIPSMILWGPPGTGKTTLANIIALELDKPFYQLSAVSSGVKEVRAVLDEASGLLGPVILFIDEIHRFNKSQQDALLGAVEKGIITLIGATTENPSFEVNSALISRCQVYQLQSLSEDELKQMVFQALENDTDLKAKQIEIKEWQALFKISGGDGRKLLNLVELVCNSASVNTLFKVTNEMVIQAAQKNIALYDKNGEQHYDIISAFIKSMRGSDPNAALYWLARMIEGGEDVKFIARRMLIFAAEDIGNANPNALVLANSMFDAVAKIGYPEARIILSQCVVYLACSPKSNASYLAIKEAQAFVQANPNLSVPLHLRNAPTKLMKEMNYGKDYQYSHNYEGHFSQQEFLPETIAGKVFYTPQDNPKENEMRRFLKHNWKDKYGY